ncbi:daf-6 [Cordylochernes scorpioides]|uniref:Daf-6 n=1 Tax=Cordylochernes scorpioides TaxID=51811 RepID=A0ABY6JXV1_9ARAC|nr:daf-6 [Cordylochernes scorpioides]
MKLNCIEAFLQRIFTKLAHATANHPKIFIAVPVAVALLCLPGAYFVSVVTNIEYQFAPTNGRTILERERAEKAFHMNYSHDFLPTRQLELKDYGRILIFSIDESNVLRSDIFDEIVKIDQEVKSISIQYDEKEWKYEDICARLHDTCYESEVLKLKDSIPDIERGIYRLGYPLTMETRSIKFQMHGVSLGGVTVDDNNHIKEAKGASLEYFLDSDRFPNQNEKWEKEFLKFAEDYQSENVKIYRFTSRSMEDEFGQDTFSSFVYFIVTVLVMLGFSMVTSMTSDCVRSKPWFGILGCTSSTLAVGAVFGLLLYFRTPFVLINLVIPFLMLARNYKEKRSNGRSNGRRLQPCCLPPIFITLIRIINCCVSLMAHQCHSDEKEGHLAQSPGIGLDDTFVLMAAWRLTDPGLEVERRLEQTYHHAGFSVTITSLTNLLAFLLGIASPYRATRLLCCYAALSVFTAFIFQLTFFGGFLVLLGRAEAANRHGLTLRTVKPLSLAGLYPTLNMAHPFVSVRHIIVI